MVSNKTLVWIIAVLVVVVLGLIIYNSMGSSSPSKTGNSASAPVISSLYLESFPAGTQMGPGLKGKQTTTFKVGELGDVSGVVQLSKSSISTIKIYDAVGGLSVEQACVDIASSGGFGCGLIIPQSPGKYTMKFYLDGVEAKSVDFEVTA